MRPFALVACLPLALTAPSVYRHCQIGIRTLSVFYGHRIAAFQREDSHAIDLSFDMDDLACNTFLDCPQSKSTQVVPAIGPCHKCLKVSKKGCAPGFGYHSLAVEHRLGLKATDLQCGCALGNSSTR